MGQRSSKMFVKGRRHRTPRPLAATVNPGLAETEATVATPHHTILESPPLSALENSTAEPSPHTSLESLPLHALENIAAQLDEISLWRFRAVSQYLRFAADKVPQGIDESQGSRPYASDRNISPFVETALALIYSRSFHRARDASGVKNRLAELSTPRSVLRRLPIEIRVNEPAARNLLQQLASRLHSLHLHVFDRSGSQEGGSEMWADVLTWDTPSLRGSGCFQPLLALSADNSLPEHNLESLVLTLTGEINGLSLALFPYANLRHLAIICAPESYYFECWLHIPELASLTLQGDNDTVSDLWSCLLCSDLPSLRRATICIPKLVGLHDYVSSMNNIITRTGITELALYGPNILTHMFSFGRDPPGPNGVLYPHPADELKMLVLEQAAYDHGLAAGVSLITNLDFDLGAPYYFKALEVITFIDRRTNEHGVSELNYDNITENDPADDIQYIRQIFTSYPTLRELRWVAEYPADPFHIATELIKLQIVRPPDMRIIQANMV